MNRFEDQTSANSSVVAMGPGPMGNCSSGATDSTAAPLAFTAAGPVSATGCSRLHHATPIPPMIAATITIVSHAGGIRIWDSLNCEDAAARTATALLAGDVAVGTPGIFGCVGLKGS